jgi:hypothetical protein
MTTLNLEVLLKRSAGATLPTTPRFGQLLIQNGGSQLAAINSDEATATIFRPFTGFAITGDATGTYNAVTHAIDLALENTGVTPGTYTKINVDEKGRVTAGGTLAAADIPTLTASKLSDFSPSVQSVAAALRLDQFATPTSDLSVGSKKIIDLATPVEASDAATKGYVDANSGSVNYNAPVAGFIYGLTASRNATYPETRLDFSSGSAWVHDRIVAFPSPIVKRLDATWAEGSGNGGLFSGSIAAYTWYHCFAMQKADRSAVDFGFSESIDASDAPSGWNCALIWSIATDAAGSIVDFVQNGSKCTWVNHFINYSASVPTTATLVHVSVPPGLNCEVQVFGQYYPASSNSAIYISDPAQADQEVNGGLNAVTAGYLNPSDYFERLLVTNTNYQIRIRSDPSNPGTDFLYLSTKAFWHPARSR